MENEDRILNIESFSEIFLAINENFEDEDIYYIYNCIVEDSNGKITCKNLVDWFSKYDVFKFNIYFIDLIGRCIYEKWFKYYIWTS